MRNRSRIDAISTDRQNCPMNHAWVDRYLRRIGLTGPAPLPELHRAHLFTVPFENLSVHLGEDIVLTGDALVAKVVDRRRGGFCYELNGAFATLLTALGHDVEFLAARSHNADGLGVPYDHMALRVGPWLVDVGFGAHSHHPLRLDHRDDQEDPGGTFRVEEGPAGDLDIVKDGVPQYRLWSRPQTLGDFLAGCWWHRTSPSSHFTRSLVCSLTTVDGRVTLSDRTLITTVSGRRDERPLTGDAEVLAAYRDTFGVVLDQVPVRRSF